MKKTSIVNHNEIDVFELIKVIWDGKLKIFIILAISILIGGFYNFLTPEVYKNSLIIKPSKNSQFAKFQKITSFLNLYEAKITKPIGNKNILEFTSSTDNYLKITSETILKSFIEELMDFEELMTVLKNIEKKNNNIVNLSNPNQNQKIIDYIKSFRVNKMEKKPDYVLEFRWDNDKESKKIIDNTIQLTLINFEKSFFKELEVLLDVKKMFLVNRDTNRIDFLKEQSLIASTIKNLEKQNININQSQETYYLRGPEAIDKEINIIKNREYKDFDDIKKDINFLKNENLNWINYNSFLIETNSITNPKRIFIISILIGLIAGIFYTLISNLLNSQNTTKK